MLKLLELFGNVVVEIYDDGRVKTKDHNIIRKNGRFDNRKGIFLKPKVDKYGYEAVTLSEKGIRKNYTVHRLVALAFIPNLENKPTINHIDCNKRNNAVGNLEWATYKEQKQHAIKNGLCDKSIEALRLANERKKKK